LIVSCSSVTEIIRKTTYYYISGEGHGSWANTAVGTLRLDMMEGRLEKGIMGKIVY